MIKGQRISISSSTQRRLGAVLSYVSLVVNAVISFFYVPLLLGFLTQEEYGVYELIGSIIAYLSVMDMGLSTTLNRFYVRERELGDKKRIENLLAMAAIIYGVLTLIAVTLGIVFDVGFDSLFGATFSEDERLLGHQMMKLVIINCAVVLPGNWFLALINANERFVFARSLTIARYVVQVAVTIIVLNVRASAVLVLAVQVTLNMVMILLYALYVFGLLEVRPKLHEWDGKLFASMLAFSFFMLLNMIYDQIFWKTGQVVLGAISGAAAVAVYGIVCKLITSGYMQVSTGMAGVFLPKLTAISTKTDDMSEINDLLCRMGHMQAILVWGVCGAFAVLGRQFVGLWAGPGFEEVYPATLLLMVCISPPLVENLMISVLQAKNRMAFRSIAYLITAVCVLGSSVVASRTFGVMGCAAATAAFAFILEVPVMNAYYARAIGVDVGALAKAVLPILVPVTVTSFLEAGVVLLMPAEGGWLPFLVDSAAYILIYLALLYALRMFGFNQYERGLVKSMARRVLPSKGD